MNATFVAAASALGIDGFEAAHRLPWALAAVAIVMTLAARRARPTIAWPGFAEIATAVGRRRDPVRWIALGLRAAALIGLATALAQPISKHEGSPEPGRGLDLVLVLDISGSMRALDTAGAIATQGSSSLTRTRLGLAREVVARFARDRVAEGDRVGLVVFGASAFTQCPLTSDGSLLAAALERVEVGMAGEATALGDALALAVKRVGPANAEGAGRAVVLLTDGRSNAGEVPVSIAMELASALEVRVHTVGIGQGGRDVPMAAVPGRPTGTLRFERHDPDLPTLERIAEATGGRFHHALRSSDLARVYGEIDSLERVDRALPARVQTTPRSEPLFAMAGGLLLLEIALARVLFRPLP